MIDIRDFDLDQALNALPSYQAELLKSLVRSNGEERTAEIWIDSNGPREIRHYGGTSGTQLVTNSNYWKRFKKQIDGFICGGQDWEEENKQAKKIGEGGIISISTGIAQAISPVLGIAVPILVPPIVLVLHVAAKAGIKAYCANKNYVESIRSNSKDEEDVRPASL